MVAVGFSFWFLWIDILIIWCCAVRMEAIKGVLLLLMFLAASVPQVFGLPVTAPAFMWSPDNYGYQIPSYIRPRNWVRMDRFMGYVVKLLLIVLVFSITALPTNWHNLFLSTLPFQQISNGSLPFLPFCTCCEKKLVSVWDVLAIGLTDAEFLTFRFWC